LIPPLEPGNGHLPPGRYSATLEEVKAAFVDAPRFILSETRPKLWNGLLRYLDEWAELERDSGQELLHAVWLAGSFISSKVDPQDVDASPVHDETTQKVLAPLNAGKRLKRLIGHRQTVVKHFNVEPFPIPWARITSTLYPGRLTEVEQGYLAHRGAYDEWWQRVRPAGQARAPEPPDCLAARGYVEVIL
jgi:hypothetical protein